MATRTALARSVIRASGLPRALIARDSGLSRVTLEYWISKRYEPRASSMRQLAAGFRRRAKKLLELADRLDRAAIARGAE